MVPIRLGVFLLLLGGVIAPAWTQDAAPPSAPSIADLLDQVEGDNAVASREAFLAIVQRGPEALPEVQKRLEARHAAALAELYLALRHPTDVVFTEAEMPVDVTRTEDDLARIAPEISTKDMSAWAKGLYAKYLQAVKLAKLSRYDQVVRTCEAIMTLDPSITFKNQVKQLKVFASERLLMKNVVRCEVRADRSVYEIGEVVDISICVENLTPDLLELDFTPSGDPNDIAMAKYAANYKPAAIFQIAYSEYDPLGTVVSRQRSHLIEIDQAIRLGPGEQWVRTFSIDTGLDSPNSQFYRSYRVQGELRPIQIRHAGQTVFRRIAIDPLLVRVFPPDVDPALQDPMGFLSRALEGGEPNDIFLCGLLVPEDKREEEIKTLVAALDKSRPVSQRGIMALLRQLTQQPVPFDVDEWVRWYADRGYKQLEEQGEDGE